MAMRKIKIIVLMLLACVFSLTFTKPAFADTHFVLDKANVLNAKTEQQITDLNKQKLTKFEGHPTISVATIRKLPQGQSLKHYSVKLFNKYHLGHKKLNNGILLVIVTQSHKTRMQLGSGIKYNISANSLSEFMDDSVKTDFRNKDYNGGVIKLTNNIYTYMDKHSEEVSSTSGHSTWLIKVAIVIIVLLIIGLIITAVKSAGDLHDPNITRARKAKMLLIGSITAIIGLIGALIALLIKLAGSSAPDDSHYNDSNFGGDGGTTDYDDDSGDEEDW